LVHELGWRTVVSVFGFRITSVAVIRSAPMVKATTVRTLSGQRVEAQILVVASVNPVQR
jgi:hypothetical protein